jgi:glutamate formiminotransferase / 5-formyltetrahydrofolate cyclo-ligase
VLEAVPNVSEGRSRDAIGEIGEAFAAGVHLLDVHSDPDHHRSVYTLVGEPAPLADALVAGAARALELVDLRLHDGVHPRVGAVDVVPFVAIAPGDDQLARKAALEVAGRIGGELSVPVFLYGEIGEGRRPAFFRRGGLGELKRRLDAGELEAAFGPRGIDPRSGAVLVGVRKPLVAYNVELDTADVEVARALATAVRESSGGLPGVQAIGLALPRPGTVQVSMNLVDLERAVLHEVIERVRHEARSRGVDVAGGELVGLVPERVLAAADAAGVHVQGVDETRVLERLLPL